MRKSQHRTAQHTLHPLFSHVSSPASGSLQPSALAMTELAGKVALLALSQRQAASEAAAASEVAVEQTGARLKGTVRRAVPFSAPCCCLLCCFSCVSVQRAQLCAHECKATRRRRAPFSPTQKHSPASGAR